MLLSAGDGLKNDCSCYRTPNRNYLNTQRIALWYGLDISVSHVEQKRFETPMELNTFFELAKNLDQRGASLRGYL
jgi:hypothetical protein